MKREGGYDKKEWEGLNIMRDNSGKKWAESEFLSKNGEEQARLGKARSEISCTRRRKQTW